MNLEEFREYCLAKPKATESTTFGPDTLVFKVGGKIFAIAMPNQSIKLTASRRAIQFSMSSILQFADTRDALARGGSSWFR